MEPLRKLLPRPSADTLARRAVRFLIDAGVEPGSIRYDPDGFSLEIENGGRYYLHNLYDFYCRAWPWQRRRVLAGFFAFRTDHAHERPATWDEVKAMILPGVRDAFMFETVRLESGDQAEPPGFALGSRLRACLVVDYPNSTSIVNATDLQAWGVTFETAQAQALENLQLKADGRAFAPIGDGLFVSPWSDCFDASRLLLPRPFADLDIQGDPVVSSPNWNRLFVAGSDHLEGLLGVIVAGMTALAEEPRPLSGLPIVRRGGEWVDLELPRGHPAEAVLRKSRVVELSSLYETQKALLERKHERDGVDVHVATYNGLRDSADRYRSYSLWSKDVVALLPKTEQVSFFDHTRGAEGRVELTADWDIVARHCSPIMKDAGYSLRRFLVESFPTEAQMESMRAAQGGRPSV